MKRFHTMVIDPPWEYGNDRMTGSFRSGTGPMKHSKLPYPTMTVKGIGALPVAQLAEKDAHLYLWATQKYLREAFDLVSGWGFSVGAVLVWSKPPKGIVGTYVCSTEFCLFARRGSLAAKKRHLGTCFSWSRGEHSAKPEAFLDLVEEVSPGPYLELFARRQRLGWNTWGDEALEHVSLEEGWLVQSAEDLAAAKEEIAMATSGVYGEWCQDPETCRPLGYCPREPTCAD